MIAKIKEKENGSVKYVDVISSCGEKYRIKEDIDGMIEVTKEGGGRLNINPRYTNQICIK